MNRKETELHRIVDAVVSCCSTSIGGEASMTRDDVLGKNKHQNVVMTRCILVEQVLFAGYSCATVAQLLSRTERSVRNIIESAKTFRRCSRAFRIAEKEAGEACAESR